MRRGRASLKASVPEFAAVFLMAEVGEDAWDRMAASVRAAGREDLAWELDEGFSQLREVARKQQARLTADPEISEGGSAEVPSPSGTPDSGRDVSSPRLTTSQVAEMLRVGPRQVVNLIGKKELLATRRGHGHPWEIEERSVRELMARRGIRYGE